MALLDWIVNTNKAFVEVEQEKFKIFVRKLLPSYKLPCRRTLVNKIPELYLILRSRLAEKLQNKNIAVTSDGWSSISKKKFISLTFQFVVAEDGSFRHGILACKKLTIQTAENIRLFLLNELQEFGVNIEDVVSITTDNASNMLAATRCMNIR